MPTPMGNMWREKKKKKKSHAAEARKFQACKANTHIFAGFLQKQELINDSISERVRNPTNTLL